MTKIADARHRPFVHGSALALIGEHCSCDVAECLVATHSFAQLGKRAELPARPGAHHSDSPLDDAHVVLDIILVNALNAQAFLGSGDDDVFEHLGSGNLAFTHPVELGVHAELRCLREVVGHVFEAEVLADVVAFTGQSNY